MQLTRAADYAVRVMIQLAMPVANARLSSRACQGHRRAGKLPLQGFAGTGARRLISSRRGQAGGFRISPRGRRGIDA